MSVSTNPQSNWNSVLNKLHDVQRLSKEVKIQSKALSRVYTVIAVVLLVFMAAMHNYYSRNLKNRIDYKRLDILENQLERELENATNEGTNNIKPKEIESSSNNNNIPAQEAASRHYKDSINKIHTFHSFSMGILGIFCGAAIVKAQKWAC